MRFLTFLVEFFDWQSWRYASILHVSCRGTPSRFSYKSTVSKRTRKEVCGMFDHHQFLQLSETRHALKNIRSYSFDVRHARQKISQWWEKRKMICRKLIIAHVNFETMSFFYKTFIFLQNVSTSFAVSLQQSRLLL